jgi:hypothetical protein
MKKLMIISTILGLSVSFIYSQQYNQIKTDSSFQANSILFWNNSIAEKKLFSGSVMDRNSLIGPISSRLSISSFDNMPCLKPEGNFSMLVLKPDSTMRYNLIIRNPLYFP